MLLHLLPLLAVYFECLQESEMLILAPSSLLVHGAVEDHLLGQLAVIPLLMNVRPRILLGFQVGSQLLQSLV